MDLLASSGPSAVVVASGLLIAGPVLRRRHPAVWWLLFGYRASVVRVIRNWWALMAGCGLAVSRRPAWTVVSGLVGNGAVPPQLRVPRYGFARPTVTGFAFLVRLLPGQLPEDFVKAAPAMAEGWQVHAVRVTSQQPGVVWINALFRNPLSGPRAPRGRAPGRLLRVVVGTLETRASWVIDLRPIPHWLLVGATRSGKSTLINALVVGLAP